MNESELELIKWAHQQYGSDRTYVFAWEWEGDTPRSGTRFRLQVWHGDVGDPRGLVFDSCTEL